MAETEFFKCYGAEQRQDKIVRLSANNYLLIFGYGEENGQGYTNRKYYDHEPTKSELKADIDALVNANTDRTILNGYVWQGKAVWLSTENQFNFKAAYDLAVQTQGANLPIKFKLGEDETGAPVYHTFTKLESFSSFIMGMFGHINAALKEGWVEKDGVDYAQLLTIVDA